MQTPTHPTAAGQWLRRLGRQAAISTSLLVPLLWLAGCGGGDPEPDQPTPSVNCAAHPETCK